MKYIAITILLFALLITSSCDKPVFGYKYDEGSLPTTPTNLSDFNSEHDDYNSSAPTLGDFIPFCFSTNRFNSTSGQFDIIYKPMDISFSKTTGELTVKNDITNYQTVSTDYAIVQTGIDKIKTSGNEFGPNMLIEDSGPNRNFTLMYSTDDSGDSQINFISDFSESQFSEPKEVVFLNSEFEDLYPSFNTDKSKIYFCSNRDEESFNFYYVSVDPNTNTETLLSNDSTYEVLKDETLSSNADDKCPFIFEDRLVFASNRAGGFGGYDLYYSEMVNGEWTAPTNFGESINSESDEFRPILLNDWVTSKQTMMIFSSDRTGGMGGFDLYFVGIDNE